MGVVTMLLSFYQFDVCTYEVEPISRPCFLRKPASQFNSGNHPHIVVCQLVGKDVWVALAWYEESLFQ